jgi:hypothetical protein
MAGTGNRVEKLNDATRETIAVLKVITNEETAKANQAKLEELAESIKEIRKGIEEATAKPDSGGAAVMNHRPWQMQIQMETSVRRQLDRIREDPEASVIVDKALDGSGFVIDLEGF